ncbi:hypothetical protein FGO68_gene9815 [Halteria grandinella]|uniref:Uncharacterized protein n=1 Tax=Halteria grandinella TaxID=5974 RepID=A0A8J8N9M7_HALGN|nr:hypothetical protein FGO68_gene9815 [Halteria grandinella]
MLHYCASRESLPFLPYLPYSAVFIMVSFFALLLKLTCDSDDENDTSCISQLLLFKFELLFCACSALALAICSLFRCSISYRCFNFVILIFFRGSTFRTWVL